jgi:hypothetical protein
MNPISKKPKPNNTPTHQDQAQEDRTTIEDSITTQLKNRMLASGEWLRYTGYCFGYCALTN